MSRQLIADEWSGMADDLENPRGGTSGFFTGTDVVR